MSTEHQTLCLLRAATDTTLDAPLQHRCQWDGKPCEVIALIAGNLTTACLKAENSDPKQARSRFSTTMAQAKRLLPCVSCRVLEKTVEAFTDLRLGKHERRVLLAAPSSGDQFQVIDPEKPGRSSDEAQRRAIQKLWAWTLIQGNDTTVDVPVRKRIEVCSYDPYEFEPTEEWRPAGSAGRRKRSVRRTALGQAVVNRLGADLRAGKPIRWANYKAGIVADCRRPAGELLAEFIEAVREVLSATRQSSVFSRRDNGAMKKDEARIEAYRLLLTAVDGKSPIPERRSMSDAVSGRASHLMPRTTQEVLVRDLRRAIEQFRILQPGSDDAAVRVAMAAAIDELLGQKPH